MQRWNKALSLDAKSHVNSFNQLVIKFAYGIGSSWFYEQNLPFWAGWLAEKN